MNEYEQFNINDLTEEQLEEFLDTPSASYDEGLEAGMKCNTSYRDGIASCPYTGEKAETWQSGFAQGFAIKHSR